MTCHKLSNVISFCMPMIHVFFVNVHFSSICDTKSILFSSKFKKKNINKLNIKYGDMQIKRSSKVKYLGCLMGDKMSGGAMALNVIHKINKKLKFYFVKMVF